MSDDPRPLILHVVFRFAVGGLGNGVVNLINRMPWDVGCQIVEVRWGLARMVAEYEARYGRLLGEWGIKVANAEQCAGTVARSWPRRN